MATSVVSVIKIGNIVPRVGIEPTSLTFRASALPLRHVGSPPDVTAIPIPTCLCSSLPQRSAQTATTIILCLALHSESA